ncbi:hypothetical protein ACWIUD_03315 [Helicobacter sp. 23-1044]
MAICLWVVISQIWRIATRHGRKVRYPCVDSPKTTKALPQNTSIVIALSRIKLQNFCHSERVQRAKNLFCFEIFRFAQYDKKFSPSLAEGD